MAFYAWNIPQNRKAIDKLAEGKYEGIETKPGESLLKLSVLAEAVCSWQHIYRLKIFLLNLVKDQIFSQVCFEN